MGPLMSFRNERVKAEEARASNENDRTHQKECESGKSALADISLMLQESSYSSNDTVQKRRGARHEAEHHKQPAEKLAQDGSPSEKYGHGKS